MSLARISISGQVVEAPEKRFTPNNTAVVTVQVSVNAATQGRQTESFVMKVTCWNRLAEAVAEQLVAGDEVLVEGKLMIESTQSAEGVAKKSFEVEASAIHKLPAGVQAVSLETLGNYAPPAPTSSPSAQPQVAAPQPVAAAAPASAQQDSFLTEEEIPF